MGSKQLKITKCKPLKNYRMWIQFDDGAEGEIDLSHLVGKGVFKAWESIEFYNNVWIGNHTGTLTWKNEIELDPYKLRQLLNQS